MAHRSDPALNTGHRAIPIAAVFLAGILLVFFSPSSVYAMLSMQEVEALVALDWGRATPEQKALLFMRNDAINRARLSGFITNEQYQAAQAEYARLNEQFAREAAEQAGAGFTVQKRTSQTFSAGTDSDYITRVRSPQQIKQMQQTYNNKINSYLQENGLDARRGDWHNRLDTDFMADPEHVSRAQFEEIARLNNDAYKRPRAAEYEAVSRAGDGTKVSPEQFRDYGLEMRDFANKKQKWMAEMRKDPMRLESPHARAEWQKLMAQEQKYISRIESATATLRQQQGLPDPAGRHPGLWDIVRDDQGNWVMKRKDSIAKAGSTRKFSNFGRTGAASAVSQNSLNRSLEELADAYADAAAKNPAFRANAADDIAQLLETLPPNQKGRFLDAISNRHGPVFTGEVAGAMRKRAGKSMSGLKVKAMKSLQVIGVGADLYQAREFAASYLEYMEKAMDPDLTDEEAEEYFTKAQEAAWGLTGVGGLAALMEAYPPVAAAFGAWTISYEGGKYLLANTETGQIINRAATDYADRHIQAYERASCEVAEYFGYDSDCSRLRKVEQDLLASVIRGIREGRWELVPGKTMRDVFDLIREGNYRQVRGLLIDVKNIRRVEEAFAVCDLDNVPDLIAAVASDNRKAALHQKYRRLKRTQMETDRLFLEGEKLRDDCEYRAARDTIHRALDIAECETDREILSVYAEDMNFVVNRNTEAVAEIRRVNDVVKQGEFRTGLAMLKRIDPSPFCERDRGKLENYIANLEGRINRDEVLARHDCPDNAHARWDEAKQAPRCFCNADYKVNERGDGCVSIHARRQQEEAAEMAAALFGGLLGIAAESARQSNRPAQPSAPATPRTAAPAACEVEFMSSGGSKKYIIEYEHRQHGRRIVVLTARDEADRQDLVGWLQRGGHRVLGSSTSSNHQAAVRTVCGACPNSRDPQCLALQR